jgi:hypothetical protein
MRATNRDLLVLVKDELLSPASMEMELERIHKLLVGFETPDNLSLVHEVFDMNRYKRLSFPHSIQKVMNVKEIKPFVFIINKN